MCSGRTHAVVWWVGGEAGGITDENLCILGLVSTCIVIFTYYVLLPVLYELPSWNKGSEFLIPDFFKKSQEKSWIAIKIWYRKIHSLFFSVSIINNTTSNMLTSGKDWDALAFR